MTTEGQTALARAELALAEECLAAAAQEHAGGFHRRCVSSCYYAAFHAARAVLAVRGFEARSHAGAQQLFSQHLIQSGEFPATDGRLLRRMQKDREEADYGLYSVFAESDSIEAMTTSREFLSRVRSYL